MKGKLSIGKVTCYGESQSDYVRIEIEDTNSSIKFVTIKVELEPFANALFGLGHIPVEFKLQGLDKIGKKLEVKHESVALSKHATFGDMRNLDKEIGIALKLFEIDGWVGEASDCKNFHCRQPDGSYKVSFYRWVDIENKNGE